MKWAPAITYYLYRSMPHGNEHDERQRKLTLLQMFRTVATEEVNETILWIAEYENEGNNFFLASRIEQLWDRELVKAFVHAIEQGLFKPENETQIARAISQHDFGQIRPLLETWLTQPNSLSDNIEQRRILAAKLIVAFESDAGWNLIWPLFQEDREFGKNVIEGVASNDLHERGVSGQWLANKLDVVSVADLYIWLIQHYPIAKRSQLARKTTIEDLVARLRNSLPNWLAEQGTTQSIEQLRRIEEATGSDLGYYLSQAKAKYLQTTWKPLEPGEFKELVRNKRTRWIQSGSQLLDAILEVLEQLNLELQGKSGSTPAVIDLWNEYKQTIGDKRATFYTPKDENRLSDYVERYLKQKLEGRNVFISRENEIRRGSRTDIYVQTKPLIPSNQIEQTITVIIEVKGCWHEALKTAMLDQLKNRYLAEGNLYHGIYLIGQFMCDRWNKEDDQTRWARSRKTTLDDLQSAYTEQANLQSSNGYDIRAYILDVRL